MQVDIPDSARSALEALRAKRLQKTNQNAAPVEDTLPPSQSAANDYGSQPNSGHEQGNSVADGSGLKGALASDSAPRTDTPPYPDDQAKNDNNAEAATPVGDTLPQAVDHAAVCSIAGSDTVPVSDSLPGSAVEPAAVRAVSPARAGSQTACFEPSSINAPAPVDDTRVTGANVSASWQETNDDEDEALINEIMQSSEQADGKSATDHGDATAAVADDDDALLQGLLNAEEQ